MGVDEQQSRRNKIGVTVFVIAIAIGAILMAKLLTSIVTQNPGTDLPDVPGAEATEDARFIRPDLTRLA